ncbi:MAG: DUF6079 family protein [bacterium]
MTVALRIGDLIEVPPVETVVRLEDGTQRPAAVTGSFVFTADVTTHFSILSEVLQQDTGRGFFLQGDFGSGKSHSLAALAAWLDERSGSEILTRSHTGLKRLRQLQRRFLPVEISLLNFRSATSLEQIVITSVEKALAAHGAPVTLTPLARFLGRFRRILDDPKLARVFCEQEGMPRDALDDWIARHPREAYLAGIRFLKGQGIEAPEMLIEERHETFAAALQAVRDAGFHGTVLLIDELSEFFRSKADPQHLNEDARTLQLLGELAGGAPLWIIAAVQEGIERTGDIAQTTFRKIKDRFPIRLNLSTMHIRDLVSKRLVKLKPGGEGEIRRIYESFRSNFTTFSCAYDHFLHIYPLHPATLALLEGLGDLFSQHRGIVDFVHSRIAGDEGRQIRGILDRPCTELLAPDSIYEHFEGRLAEFSDFHIYPRHILPHLDEVIERIIEDPSDRALARRLVRILVLYAIHPTAEPPPVRVLAELTSCMIAPHDPAMNVEFVAEGILDPLVEESRFLTRRPGSEARPPEAVYAIAKGDDPAKTLKARIARTAGEIGDHDSRLLTEPLSELPESISWPGPGIARDVVFRSLAWRQSTRLAACALVPAGMDSEMKERVLEILRKGEADFALLLVLGTPELACEHTAAWRIPFADAGSDVLRELLATRMVLAELKPSNPADAPLVPIAQAALKRLDPAAHQVVLGAIYRGDFVSPEIRIDPAVRQLKRFDRLVEAAGEVLLEARYPKFKDIASRGFPPSPRLYQRLLDEWAAHGKLSLREAKDKGLGSLVESLAAPLGLVEIKAGSYLLAPDPHEHPFLAHVFSFINPSGATPLEELVSRLRSGAYGVPRDTAEFVLNALAHCGLITLLRHDRRVPLDSLRMAVLDKADAVAPGELIGQADRRTLLAECTFLAPAQSWESFGVRQQQEAWQAVIRFKAKAAEIAGEIERGLTATAGYSALDALDRERLRARLDALGRLRDGIKTSYAARDGLECFLQAWRASGLTSEDVTGLKQFQRFFSTDLDAFIFSSHYVRHPSVGKAILEDEGVDSLRQAVLAIQEHPETLVVPDGGMRLNAAFNAFRQAYTALYAGRHASHHGRRRRREIPKRARRAVEVLRRLAAIEPLDRPVGLETLLAEIDAPSPQPCERNVAEELVRSPVCGCLFQIGARTEEPRFKDITQAVESSLAAYLEILRNPRVLEQVGIRAYALKDMDSRTTERLRRLTEILRDPQTGSPAALLDLLDAATIEDLAQALSGSVEVEERSLERLTEQLSGRRLTGAKILEIVEQWTSGAGAETLLSVTGETPVQSARPAFRTVLWPLLRPDLFADELRAGPMSRQDVRAMEQELEQMFPQEGLMRRLTRLETARLFRFVVEEPVHTRAAQAAWLLLAEKVLRYGADAPFPPPDSRHLAAEEAAAIRGRLEALKRLSEAEQAGFPERLCGRLPMARILFDPWATRELKAAAEAAVEALSAAAEDWLATLPAAAILDLKDNPGILLLEAVPPDVWLEATRTAASPRPHSLTWRRLTVEPKTIPSMNQLFGFSRDRDPAEEFASWGIPYRYLAGNEERPLIDLVPPLPSRSPWVIRLCLLDHAAHREGARRLTDMPAMLRNMLDRQLPPVLEACSRAGRRLALTTDHGLSLRNGQLTHGAGGVFEKAVFLAQWMPETAGL